MRRETHPTRPHATFSPTRAAARLVASMAALLALLLACAPVVAASATAQSPASGISAVDDDLAGHATPGDARAGMRDGLRRPKHPPSATRRDAAQRRTPPAPPLAATGFIPPQRKTLLRLLH